VKKFWLVFALASFSLFAQEATERKEEGKQEAAKEEEAPMEGWKWANFAILAGALGFLMAKTLPAFFASRTAEIQKGIAEAQAAKQDAERRAADIDKRVSSLGVDIENFRSSAAREMEQEGARIRQETATLIKKLESQSQAEIESAGKIARRDLSQHAADLALRLAEQRVRERLDGSSEAALIDGFVADLARQGAKN